MTKAEATDILNLSEPQLTDIMLDTVKFIRAAKTLQKDNLRLEKENQYLKNRLKKLGG